MQLLLPGPHVDHPFAALQGNNQHQRLLEAGVEIGRYLPSMLHVKVVTVDGSVAMVGSANIDARSLALNEQLQSSSAMRPPLRSSTITTTTT